MDERVNSIALNAQSKQQRSSDWLILDEVDWARLGLFFLSVNTIVAIRMAQHPLKDGLAIAVTELPGSFSSSKYPSSFSFSGGVGGPALHPMMGQGAGGGGEPFKPTLTPSPSLPPEYLAPLLEFYASLNRSSGTPADPTLPHLRPVFRYTYICIINVLTSDSE